MEQDAEFILLCLICEDKNPTMDLSFYCRSSSKSHLFTSLPTMVLALLQSHVTSPLSCSVFSRLDFPAFYSISVSPHAVSSHHLVVSKKHLFLHV